MSSKAKQTRHDHKQLRERLLPGNGIKADRQQVYRWIHNSFPKEVSKSFVRYLDHLGWDRGAKSFKAIVKEH
jgi:hypothetical protein